MARGNAKAQGPGIRNGDAARRAVPMRARVAAARTRRKRERRAADCMPDMQVSAEAMNMSTIRCCNAWNEPRGTPNCWRDFRNASVASLALDIAPTASEHSNALAKSTASSISGNAPPSWPSRASAGKAAAIKPDIAGPSAVQSPVAVDSHAWVGPLDEKKAGAAGGAGRDHHDVCPWCAIGHQLAIVQLPAPRDLRAVVAAGSSAKRRSDSRKAKQALRLPSSSDGSQARRWVASPARAISRPARAT